MSTLKKILTRQKITYLLKLLQKSGKKVAVKGRNKQIPFTSLVDLLQEVGKGTFARELLCRGGLNGDIGGVTDSLTKSLVPTKSDPRHKSKELRITNYELPLWAVSLVLLIVSSACVPTEQVQSTVKINSYKPDKVVASTTPVDTALLQDLESRLYQQLQTLIAQKQGARQNGYVYTVDLSQILMYAALKKDRRLYFPLRDFAIRNLIINKQSDPYTRGFVLWRYQPGNPPDASGTTEALRLAESLWLGSQVFGEPSDRAQAILILKGYARHAHVDDHQVWLIRNYFNLQTRAFATNSFLLGYDPDLLQDVGGATGDSTLQAISQKSYSMVRQAVNPSGLLYDIVQPEVLTLVPELNNLVIFSPNDVVKLANTCTVVERATLGAPETGQKVISFASKRLPKLSTYYYGRTGEPVIEKPAEVATYACLVRLAIKLKDQKAFNAFLEPFISHAQAVTQNTEEFSLYTVIEALLTLQLISHQSSTSQNKAESTTVNLARLNLNRPAF